MLKENFINYIRFEKRYSNNTVLAYEKDINQFCEFIVNDYQISSDAQINHHMVRSWIASLADNEVTPRSIKRKISTLKSYFKFLTIENLIDDNPLLKLSIPKSKKRLPEFLSEEKMDFLLDEIAFDNDFSGVRDKLILELFYHTGMRLSELVGLTDNSFDFYNQQLKIKGKRNKERIVPFTKSLENSINTYLLFRKKVIPFEEQNQSFFVTDKGEKIYSKLVYRIVRSNLSKVSTLNKKSPHVLRHTFATHMLNKGADINAIKELLGHSNLAATQIYTHNSIDKLKTIYKQAHPRA
jgi:integrase/recombinase XerC